MGIFSGMKKRIVTIVRDQNGVAFIEFALSITLLLIMFYGATELTRYILIVQKVEKTVDTFTDVIAQAQPAELKDGDVLAYLSAAQKMMNPYTFGANGAIILTDIQTGSDPTAATVNWQVCGGGTFAATSKVSASGAAGSSATLPPAFTMTANEETVIGEIFYSFMPLLQQSYVTAAQVYRVAVFKPRFGTLNTTQTYVPCL